MCDTLLGPSFPSGKCTMKMSLSSADQFFSSPHDIPMSRFPPPVGCPKPGPDRCHPPGHTSQAREAGRRHLRGEAGEKVIARVATPPSRADGREDETISTESTVKQSRKALKPATHIHIKKNKYCNIFWANDTFHILVVLNGLLFLFCSIRGIHASLSMGLFSLSC